jgi:hypothetical protein
MSIPIPYLADEMIESDAELLLAEYAHARGIVIAPPIPIEDICPSGRRCFCLSSQSGLPTVSF